MAIAGFESTVLMKLWHHTKISMISILEELKKTEFRILEAVENYPVILRIKVQQYLFLYS